jgi:hypothetical protein
VTIKCHSLPIFVQPFGSRGAWIWASECPQASNDLNSRPIIRDCRLSDRPLGGFVAMMSIDDCSDVFDASRDSLSDHRDHKTIGEKCWSEILPRSFPRSRVSHSPIKLLHLDEDRTHADSANKTRGKNGQIHLAADGTGVWIRLRGRQWKESHRAIV